MLQHSWSSHTSFHKVPQKAQAEIAGLKGLLTKKDEELSTKVHITPLRMKISVLIIFAYHIAEKRDGGDAEEDAKCACSG